MDYDGTTNCVFRKFLKDLEELVGELEIKERIETIQTTALLRLAMILWKVLEICVN